MVGCADGIPVGWDVGVLDEGAWDGWPVGCILGCDDGKLVGNDDGCELGTSVGCMLG